VVAQQPSKIDSLPTSPEILHYYRSFYRRAMISKLQHEIIEMQFLIGRDQRVGS
jgi:polyphosphate kinase 2 (PPK2 family)